MNLRIEHNTRPIKGNWPPVTEGRACVACVVRDGQEFLDEFLKHYLELGFNHIFLMDNGSTDATVPLAKSYTNVTVLTCTLPFREYETAMKHYLSYTAGRCYDWVALVDIDEFLAWPGGAPASLQAMLDYSDKRGFTAVLTQMLDMHPAQWSSDPTSRFNRTEHCFYNLEDVQALPYAEFSQEHALTSIASYPMTFNLNGFRWRLFQLARPLWLTKHSLLRPSRGAWISHPHITQDATLADFTATLLHYHFSGGLYNKVSTALRDHRYGWSADEEYSHYSSKLSSGHLDMLTPTSQKLSSLNELLTNGFLTASDRAIRELGFGN